MLGARSRRRCLGRPDCGGSFDTSSAGCGRKDVEVQIGMLRTVEDVKLRSLDATDGVHGRSWKEQAIRWC